MSYWLLLHVSSRRSLGHTVSPLSVRSDSHCLHMFILICTSVSPIIFLQYPSPSTCKISLIWRLWILLGMTVHRRQRRCQSHQRLSPLQV